MKYDVVIVGGGSDGCTLAARLSEDAGLQIATSGSRADIIGILLLDAREGASGVLGWALHYAVDVGVQAS